MNPAQFIQLNELEQMEVIWERAVYIGERSSDMFTHILYNLDGLFIEETRYAVYNIWHQYQCIQDNNVLLQYSCSSNALV